MREYLYVISNPSMPGLIKVGTTTNTPNERMSELHSTGVPTPFQLELSIKVENGKEAEKIAHSALSKHRVAKNREFFKVRVEKAVETILSSLAQYEIHEFKDGLKAEEIENETQRRKIEKEQQRYDRLLKEVNEKRAIQKTLQEKKTSIEIDIKRLKQDRRNLGPEPIGRELNGIEELLMIAYNPIPLGFITWGALFNPATTMFAIPVLILGFFANKKDNELRSEISKKLKPFNDLDSRISSANTEIQSITEELENLEIPVLPQNPYRRSSQIKPQNRANANKQEGRSKAEYSAPEPMITWDNPCKGCNQSFKVTVSKNDDYAICPACYYRNPVGQKEKKIESPKKSEAKSGIKQKEEAVRKNRTVPYPKFVWDDKCGGCSHAFKVTLPKGEDYATCPNCFFKNKYPFKYRGKYSKKKPKTPAGPTERPSPHVTKRSASVKSASNASVKVTKINARESRIIVSCYSCGLSFEHEDSHLFSCPKCHTTIFRD